jgi:hypothetical protein
VKYWEIIADNLNKAGSFGTGSGFAVDVQDEGNKTGTGAAYLA